MHFRFLCNIIICNFQLNLIVPWLNISFLRLELKLTTATRIILRLFVLTKGLRQGNNDHGKCVIVNVIERWERIGKESICKDSQGRFEWLSEERWALIWEDGFQD